MIGGTGTTSGASSRTITWTGAGGDGLWSNPANWQGEQVPGASDTARFAGRTSHAAADACADARADDAFGGVLAGLVVEADYTSDIRLEHALTIRGAARVSGGVLTTPAGAALSVASLRIDQPGVVRLGENGKLNLSGDGEPLTGDGLLE